MLGSGYSGIGQSSVVNELQRVPLVFGFWVSDPFSVLSSANLQGFVAMQAKEM
jgi:hypothetical protein